MDNQIPAQVEGTQIDASATTEFTTPRAAVVFYEIAKKRLLNVSAWSEICEVPLSTFKLTDATGNTVNRDATEGDYIRIDIPGPGTHSGDGFDWVRIEKITEEIAGDNATLSLSARPSANPANEDPAIAHFFTQHATSTFQVKRVGHRVFAEEHGRNEVPNTDTSILTDNIRNTLVGWSAKLGLSYPQWKSLVKGIAATEQA
jgi:hypothetical protein